MKEMFWRHEKEDAVKKGERGREREGEGERREEGPV